MLDVLVDEALQVVTLEEILRVVGTVAEVVKVDAGIGVNAVGVATEAERLGISSELSKEIAENTASGCVGVGRRTAVPVLQVNVSVGLKGLCILY